MISGASPNDTGPPPAGRAGPDEPRVSSVELFRGRQRIIIVHRGNEYRLQITRAGKLILTK